MALVVAPGKHVLYNDSEGTSSRLLGEGEEIPGDASEFEALGYACSKGDYDKTVKVRDRKLPKREPEPLPAPDTPAPLVEAPPEPDPEPEPAPEPEPEPEPQPEPEPVDPDKETVKSLVKLAKAEGVELPAKPGTKAEIASAILAARAK